MESYIETSSNSKPALAPKPCLAPKPFSLQNNIRFRSFTAPKPPTSPKPPKLKIQQSETTTIATPNRDSTADKPDMTDSLSKPTVSVTTPSSAGSTNPLETRTNFQNIANKPYTARRQAAKENVSQTKVPVVTISEPKHSDKTKEDAKADASKVRMATGSKEVLKTTIGMQNVASQVDRTDSRHPASELAKANIGDANVKGAHNEDANIEDARANDEEVIRREQLHVWGGSRKRLSAELKARFEAGGLPNVMTERDEKEENNVSEVTEECTNGGSIRGRISLLFREEERKRVGEEKKREQEMKRVEEEMKREEEIKRVGEEMREEEMKREEERKRVEEERKTVEEEEKRVEEIMKREEEGKKVEEEKRVEDEKKREEEKKRVEEMKKREEERKRVEEERKKVEERKREEERKRVEEEDIKRKEEKKRKERVLVSREGGVKERMKTLDSEVLPPAGQRSNSFARAPELPATESSSEKCPNQSSETTTGAGEKEPNDGEGLRRKRRSVRFGVVETDDGGPTIILGSEPSSDEEEEEEEEEEEKEEERQKRQEEEEGRKHLEFELRRKMEERAALEGAEEEEEEGDRMNERLKEEVKMEEALERQKIEKELKMKRLKREEEEKQKRGERERGGREQLQDIAYDDFSVKKSIIDVDFDDFSVKPRRWSSRAERREERLREEVEREEEERGTEERGTEERGAEESMPSPQEERRQAHSQTETSEGSDSEVIEEDLKEELKEESKELKEEIKEEPKGEPKVEIKEELKEELKDDREQPEGVHSPVPVPEWPPRGSTDSDAPDVPRTINQLEGASFPETTPLLDTRAQRSKVYLGRRRSRARPPRSVKVKNNGQIWRTCDSTDGPVSPTPDLDTDVELKPNRVSLFPRVSPAALIAQIKKRTLDRGVPPGDGNAVTDGSEEQTGAPPTQLSHSPQPPRSAHHMAGAMMVLPPIGSTGSGSSPAWLQELKSKKRFGQDGES